MTTENTNSTTLDISDIQSVVAIIDYAAEQGAFKGWQIINQVAGVRARLAGFLEIVAAAQKSKEDAEEATSPVADETAATQDGDANPVLAPGA